MNKDSQSKIIDITEELGMNVELDPYTSRGAHTETWEVLIKDKDGFPIKSVSNLANILRGDPRYASLCFNVLSSRYMLDGKDIEDHHIMEIREDIEVRYALQRPYNEVYQTVMMVARKNELDPVRDYLESLTWDGEERIKYLGENVFKAEVNEFSVHLVRKMCLVWFASAAGRGLFPGCKADGCLLLTGEKATMKSTSLAILGGEWFSDSYLEIGSKDGKEMLHQSGTWLWELAEMYSLKGKSAENAKSFLSATNDRYRPSYGRALVTKDRRCIFAATTNDFEFLTDGTDRRFLPIKVTGKIDVEYLRKNRDQIWAEATHLAKNKYPFYIGIEEFEDGYIDWEAELQRYQQSFIVEDPWAMKILETLESAPPNSITVPDLMEALDLKPYQQTKKETNRICKICRSLGWDKSKSRPRGFIRTK